VFTRDLKRLMEDLRKTGDEAAVILQYKDALALKREVCCEFWLDFMTTCSHPKGYQGVGKGEVGRRCDCPRQADGAVGHRALCCGPQFSSPPDFRILERLAGQGWREDILSYREDYVKSIVKVDGLEVTQPLTEKGGDARNLEEIYNLRTVFSVGRAGSHGTRCNAKVQKGDR